MVMRGDLRIDISKSNFLGVGLRGGSLADCGSIIVTRRGDALGVDIDATRV